MVHAYTRYKYVYVRGRQSHEGHQRSNGWLGIHSCPKCWRCTPFKLLYSISLKTFSRLDINKRCGFSAIAIWAWTHFSESLLLAFSFSLPLSSSCLILIDSCLVMTLKIAWLRRFSHSIPNFLMHYKRYQINMSCKHIKFEWAYIFKFWSLYAVSQFS